MSKRIISILTTVVMVVSLVGLLPAVTAGALTYGDYEYEILDDGTVEITDYNWSASEIEIPSKIDGKTVTSIGDYAFYDFSSLKSITMPNSVTSIGDFAFHDCSSLISVILGNSVTSIGNGAFIDCYSLTSITIPNSVMSIGDHAFCSCGSLTNITIPNSVASIGEKAFFETPWLENKQKENPLVIVNGILIDATTYSEKGLIIPNGVTFIGNGAFVGCSMTSILIPDSVKRIGESAFYLCSSLTNIIIPNSVTNIGDFAFEDCMSLSNVQISNSLKTIGYATFAGCRLLNSITIPNSVTTIGRSAFGDCYSLTSITIPSSVTSIESSAFLNCSNLKDVYYTGNQEVWNNINIGDYNDALLNATIHYNSVSDNDYNKIIDVDIYKAQCFAGIAKDEHSDAVQRCNELYNYYINENIYSPTQSFLDAVYEDQALMDDYNEWRLYSLAAEPSSALDLVMKKSDYYESLIISMFSKASQSESEWQKFLNNKIINSSNKMLKQLCNIANVGQVSELVDNLNIKDSKTVGYVKQTVENYFPTGVASKVTGVVGDVLETAKDITDLVDKLSAYGSMVELDSSAKLWLEQMYNSCTSSTDTALKNALLNLKSSSTGFAKTALVMIKETSFSISNWAIKTAIDDGITALASTNPVVMAVCTGLKAGKTICNMFFSSDDVCEQLFLMECIYDVQDLSRNVAEDSRKTFVSAQTKDNALTFTYAVDCYYESIINVDIDCMEDFLDKLYNGGILKGMIKWVYGAIEDYQECINILEDLKNTRNDNYTLMNLYFKAALKANYPEIYELYFKVNANYSPATTPTKSTSVKSPQITTKSNTKSTAPTTIKKAKIKNLNAKATGKKITVSWKKIKNAKGYQVQAATNKKFKKKQIVFDKKTKNKKITIKGNKIKKNRIYYIRVRAYTISKNADGKPKYTYSKWTKKKVKNYSYNN